jgi:hypothetical protein
MYLLGRKSKKQSIFTNHDLGTNDIFSLNHDRQDLKNI